MTEKKQQKAIFMAQYHISEIQITKSRPKLHIDQVIILWDWVCSSVQENTTV